jgi:hypothetical protein
MYLLIRYPDGIIVETLVLAQTGNRMRVAAAGFPDIMELSRSGGQWFTESRQPVEFDFAMGGAAAGEIDSIAIPARLTMTAGQEAFGL